MKKSFREYHLLQILNSFVFESPLDVHLSQYFKNHKAIGSKDRREIAEKIYLLIRWLGLVDYHCQNSHGWEERLEALERLSVKKKLEDPSIPLHIRASFPKDFFTLLTEHYGEKKAFSLCLSSNTEAPTTIRTNVLKTTRQALYQKWKEQFSIQLTQNSVFGIQFDKRVNFGALDEFRSGFFEVQDEASQLAANLVEAIPGQHILDFCAGSGGKTLAFAHKLQGTGQIFLHDIRNSSLKQAKRRLKRAGIENAQILPHDAPHKKQLLGKMDWVFVDVPCSGSGTLRRNPDIKWKFQSEHLHNLVKEQRMIMKEALSFLSPKGRIVYATCSILPQENQEQLAFFEKEFGLIPTTKPLQTFPTVGGMDGFFAAPLKRVDH